MSKPRVVDYEHTHITREHLRSPEPGGACCYGAAFTDGDNCTCWEPVNEPAPVPIEQCQEGPMPVNRYRCGDCAYRRDSPERQAIDGDTMPYTPGGVFMCHVGMPRAVRYEHPSGAVVEHPDPDGPHADYDPVTRGDRAWQADGRPAVVCAGWAADDRAYQAARQKRST
ncbi:hypothetical protein SAVBUCKETDAWG_70 [Gordonia phage Savbucketdawg]|nr:hypothetical protein SAVBUCKETDAWG_70 [Gordonia phage Savbucketdawg]